MVVVSLNFASVTLLRDWSVNGYDSKQSASCGGSRVLCWGQICTLFSGEGGEFLGMWCVVGKPSIPTRQGRWTPEATSWVLSLVRSRPCGSRLVLFILPIVLTQLSHSGLTVFVPSDGVWLVQLHWRERQLHALEGIKNHQRLPKCPQTQFLSPSTKWVGMIHSVATDPQCCKRHCKTPPPASKGKFLEFPCTLQRN